MHLGSLQWWFRLDHRKRLLERQLTGVYYSGSFIRPFTLSNNYGIGIDTWGKKFSHFYIKNLILHQRVPLSKNLNNLKAKQKATSQISTQRPQNNNRVNEKHAPSDTIKNQPQKIISEGQKKQWIVINDRHWALYEINRHRVNWAEAS